MTQIPNEKLPPAMYYGFLGKPMNTVRLWTIKANKGQDPSKEAPQDTR